jgi:2-C-methyl-D-erythritol 4-phosphate cytidylyltransferase/2-C-methyl-D-erythritol 2,4-cyclodiphosphate synthase
MQQNKAAKPEDFMRTDAIIVAAGRGRRAGGGLPKQWRDLGGVSVAARTVQAFLDHPLIERIVLVHHPDDAADVARLPGQDQLICVLGGETRNQSVRNGLEAMATDPPANVLIHDVARPCVPAQVISDVIDALGTAPGAAPALPGTDALWRGEDDSVTGVQDRAGLYRAQTPQGFDFGKLLAAHRLFQGEAADDVQVARAAGLRVAIVPGHEDNLKITHPGDFDRALKIQRGQMDIRLGNGYDVHRFGPGDHVILCGVEIPHGRGLQGHSDADVGMHAVTDAIYGALAEGDIGRHFPPSDPQWKGAASEIFLKHAAELAREKGFEISNIDCTLVCEYPKVGPHAAAMQAEMARIMGMAPERVSIKATTSERLGFTGREEGIAAIATAALVKA